MKDKIYIHIILLSFLLISTLCFSQNKGKNNTTVNFAMSSHQDMAWMDTPDKCTEFRIEKLLMPSIQRAERDSSYCFTMEYALTLDEFLRKYPERKDEICLMTRRKNLDWGATFNQPYEGLLSGEALVREVYLGKKWLQKQIPGAEFLTAFNPDVPGRALQTSQIYAKAGIKYSIISRFEPGIYRWYSPDGSSILCASNGIYCDYARRLDGMKKKKEKMKYILSIVDFWKEYYDKYSLNQNILFLHTDDNETPYDFEEIFKELNSKRGATTYRYSTVSSAMAAIEGENAEPIKLEGERPNIWLYIHDPTHHNAVSMMREAQRTLASAEKFSTIYSLLSGSFDEYPQDKFNEAWKCSIYPDHGWGGNGGNITDAFYSDKFKQALTSGKDILSKAISGIGEKIASSQEGIPVIVFNPEGWMRSDIVNAKINVYGIDAGKFVLTDEKGKEIQFQYIQDENLEPNQIAIAFKADSVPSIGYKSYYLKHIKYDENQESSEEKRNTSIDIDNDFYRISFAPGGIKSLYDKRLNRELLKTDKFLGGEIFCTTSVGTGAGEFTEIQPIDMRGFEKSSDYSPKWNIIESGIIREVRECRSRFNNATITQRVIVYNQIPRIDFDIDISGFDGTPYKEFRMTLPLNQASQKTCYEVPMGVVEVGKDDLSIPAGHSGGAYYNTPLCDTPLRECQDWFSSYDNHSCVMVSSSVGVFGFKDATENPVDYPVLQPVLLASRRSCNWLGNWYLQQGNHSYHFTFQSGDEGWKEMRQDATQAAQPMIIYVGEKNHSNGTLPASNSFFSIKNRNAVISTIKKCEDDNSVIIRLFDIEGIDSGVEMKSFMDINDCKLTNIIEEEQEPVKAEGNTLNVQLGHYSIDTYKINFKQ